MVIFGYLKHVRLPYRTDGARGSVPSICLMFEFTRRSTGWILNSLQTVESRLLEHVVAVGMKMVATNEMYRFFVPGFVLSWRAVVLPYLQVMVELYDPLPCQYVDTLTTVVVIRVVRSLFKSK